MSEIGNERLPGFDGSGDAEDRREYGRQLAMDSILRSIGAEARAPRRGHRLIAAAALVVLCGGAGFMLFRSDGSPMAPELSRGTERLADLPQQLRPKAASGSAGRAVRPADPLPAPSRNRAESSESVSTAQESVTVGEAAPAEKFAPPRTDAMPSDPVLMLKSDESSSMPVDLPRGNHPPVSSLSPDTESYDRQKESPFATAEAERLSTFSIDVDTASYANVRDLLKRSQRPPPDAVRIEEMVNYFDYTYPQPQGAHPVAIHADMSQAPWAPRHRLVRIGLQARKAFDDRPAANLVFLVDVSGSMSPQNKLPLLKSCLEDLCRSLRADDRIAIVVYAGAAGLALPSTPVAERATILRSLGRLNAGGSTNGGAGIELAYKVARENFVEKGINRVILCSDGDFNVGIADRTSLIAMIEGKRETGVFLSVLGFGRGNLRDSQMEQLADKGNGAYHYIDSAREGHRVLVEKLDASLMTIAKDVKVQVEFNPARVASYRLIGYANRRLRKQDFKDDTKDAGEMGAGHTVTALYEIVPVGASGSGVDGLRYGPKKAAPPAPTHEFGDELLFVKVRYKHPAASTSIELGMPVKDDPRSYEQASADFRFAAAVAAFGMILRDSPHKGTATFQQVLALAEDAMGQDPGGTRQEFLELVQAAQAVMGDRR